MRPEDLSPEQIEQAKACATSDERMAFIRDNGIDLTDEEMDCLAGGVGIKEYCMGDPRKKHKWVETGVTRPGRIFGKVWLDKEFICTVCGKKVWVW